MVAIGALVLPLVATLVAILVMIGRPAGKIRWIESLNQLRPLTFAEGPLGGAGGYCPTDYAH
jgi:hypothetical protein